MNNEEKGQPMIKFLHMQGDGPSSIEGNGQSLDSGQAEGPIENLEQVRFSSSPRSVSIGTVAMRKRSWGRQVSVRRSSSQLEYEDAANVSPEFERAATWGREQRSSVEENRSPECHSSCSEPNEGKTIVHAQVS
jgi:hypothetical protein